MTQSRSMSNRLAVLSAIVSITALVHAQAIRPREEAGAAGAWLKLLKTRTTASAMHTTAHPDDEHGGVLTRLSRGEGARVSLLTLNRGEAGDNAIGSELFDALGLIRTEELLDADTYYGVDRQYFTTVVDYGFSKRLDEALAKWGKDEVLRDVVRIIRMDRPFVLISRFQGNERDGHGNHQTAGLITQEAFRAAGNPQMFPDQIAEGLPPWQPLKVYMGGVRSNEDWTLEMDAGQYDPVLGDSYQNFSRRGLAYQRSQNGGRLNLQPGPSVSYYKRLASVVDAPAKEKSFFDGIDTSIPGIYRALRKQPPAGAALLREIDRGTAAAVQSFTITNPSASAPALARALAATRRAIARLGDDPDVRFVLATKEQQIQEAIAAALSIGFTAIAQPAGSREPAGPFAAFAEPPTMGPVIPGQTFEVQAVFTNRSPQKVGTPSLGFVPAPAGWTIRGNVPDQAARTNQPVTGRFTITVPADARPTFPYFYRASIQEPRYSVSDPSQRYRPVAEPPLVAAARFEIDGQSVVTRTPVTHLESNLPYGNAARVVAVLPAIAVNLTPMQAIVPLSAGDKNVHVRAEVLNNYEGDLAGTLKLNAPAGWNVEPATHSFKFAHAGERALYAFTVRASALEDREYRLEATALAGGREYRQGYDTIAHRDLETRYLPRDAVSRVRGIDVRIAPRLKVGYVMGIGDEVPSAIQQLGAEVRLLAAQDLASADLAAFDAIVTGTRAYAVREDLKTYSSRLLEYVRNGGNLIVLYNTQELEPATYAPFPADLPRSAEEVSEEDSPVEILAPDEPVLNTPNKITQKDFEQWVEQRGSKFWSSWDAAYTPIIATWDKGQPPQRGGWLHARYGKGHYTYFAYALHRQLPYGVPGAYRLLANLLSLSASERPVEIRPDP